MPASAPYTLSLLSEYTHTLDSLPIDLSKNFADLRELDAVLSSSIHSITSKVHNLTNMIEEGTSSKEERLWLLSDIAEDAQRLKLGGEDKIRVACQAADNLKAHTGHLRTLTEHIPGFDTSVLDRKTEYPHVSERAYMPALTTETGRRRRGGIGSIMVATNPEPSPAKRKRVARDDDVDITARSPKKPTQAESNARGRNNGRAKKVERAASPSDSLVSVTSHLPPQIGHSTSARGGSGAASNRAGGVAATNKRSRAGAGVHTTSFSRPPAVANEPYTAPQNARSSTANSNGASSSRRGAANAANNTDSYNNVPPSSSHPSLPAPFQSGNGNGAAGHIGSGFDAHGMPIPPGAQDWNIPRAQQLEGPGMPVARSASIHSTAASVQVVANSTVDTTDAGDGDGDGDDRTYCFCDGVSYGEMIACDDENCEREWFHLACIGLAVPPDGAWFCDSCKGKKVAKRAVRGGKRRTGGGRAGGRG